MRERNKQRVATRSTINGVEVSGVVLSKSGIPMLNDRLGFMTMGRTSGSVKDRSTRKVEV